MALRWGYGVFLGRAMGADQNFIGLKCCKVMASRAMTRLVPQVRWDANRIERICATPFDHSLQTDDFIEAEIDPHRHDETVPEETEDVQVPRRMKLLLKDLRTHGFTRGCPKCMFHEAGDKRRATVAKHSEECRLRMYKAMRDAKVERMRKADERDAERDVDRKPDEAPKKRTLKPSQNPSDAVDARPELAEGHDLADEDMGGERPGGALPDVQQQIPPLVDDSDDDMPNEDELFGSENSCPPTDDRDMDDDLVAEESDHNPLADTDDMVSQVLMTSVMDCLQTLGVSSVEACAYAASVVKSCRKPVTFGEVYGRGKILADANNRPSLNVHGLFALDLTTNKPDGTPWDFNERADRLMAIDLIDRLKPMWLILSPPCTSFCLLNRNINYPKMDPIKVQQLIMEGKRHLRFAVMLARKQISGNQHFLFEHPLTSTSWKDGALKELCGLPKVQRVVADQCQYGLVVPGPDGGLIHARKATAFVTSSPRMAQRLSRRCDHSHDHKALHGKDLERAAFYPMKLRLEILRGMRDEADHADTLRPDDEEAPNVLAATLACQEPVNELPRSVAFELRQEKAPTCKVAPFKLQNGKSLDVRLSDNMKPAYTDEYTREKLPPHLLMEAMADELSWLNERVWEGVPIDEAKAQDDAIIVGTRLGPLQ